MAYHSNHMSRTRRSALLTFSAPLLAAAAPQLPGEREPQHGPPDIHRPDEDAKLPNGKSQKDAIARQNHEASLKDASDLVTAAKALEQELKDAGSYVVQVASVKRTEDIEKLARRIRSRLKA
jgi:cell division septation protein DedD